MSTNYNIHTVYLEKEFKTCPICGYTDGFHTMLQRSGENTRQLFICPACHEVFNIEEKD